MQIAVFPGLVWRASVRSLRGLDLACREPGPPSNPPTEFLVRTGRKAGIPLPVPSATEECMHRSTHKMPAIVFALLVAVVGTQALADGSRYHGSQYHGSQNHGPRHYGSHSNYPRVV